MVFGKLGIKKPPPRGGGRRVEEVAGDGKKTQNVPCEIWRREAILAFYDSGSLLERGDFGNR